MKTHVMRFLAVVALATIVVLGIFLVKTIDRTADVILDQLTTVTPAAMTAQAVTATPLSTAEPKLGSVKDDRVCWLVAYPSGNGSLECDMLPEFSPYVGYSGLTSSTQERISFDVQFSGEPLGCLSWVQRDINSRAAFLVAECEIKYGDEESSYQLFTIPVGQALTIEEVTATPTPNS